MKRFYYTSKDYLGRTYTEEYNRLGRYKKIYYNLSGDPYFIHNGRRYRLDKFLRLSSMWAAGNVEIKSRDGENVVLCGSEMDNYYKPLFIELSADGDGVRVYQFVGSTTEE